MLATTPVIAFVATSDPDRTLRFYRDVLGLRFIADEPHALVFDAGGTMLRIQKAGGVVVPPYTTLGWRVDDVPATLAALAERGVAAVRYDFLPQDAQGVWTTPDGAKIAWFRDPDGHTLSLTSFPR